MGQHGSGSTSNKNGHYYIIVTPEAAAIILWHILGKVHAEKTALHCAEMLKKLFGLWHATNIYS